MSGTPKKVLEDGGHSMTSKRPLEDNSVFSNLSGKPAQPIASEHRLQFEAISDGRISKVPRLEPREIERRSSIVLPIYQATPSANESSFDHSSASENKPELRDMKDGRDASIEIRETKVEAKDVYSETRAEPRSSKVESEARVETRTDDKELKPERDSHTDLKSEAKADKDNTCAASSHLSWKEPKDHRRGGRYFESSADGSDPWRVSQHNPHSTVESCKEIPFGEGRAPLDVAETIGENKTDFKGEEKNKEKDRKRKEEKYRDWAEKDKERNDRQNSLPLGYLGKDLMKEDKDAERWDRERKNSQKDKDWKDREKDIVKKSLSTVHEKDSTQTEKETFDSSVKIFEKEHAPLEPKRPKEFDNWKASARENKERKRDQDQDVELDRHDKRNRVFDKESDEVAAEGDLYAERDKDLIGSGVQQRRRMLRPRGSSQVSNREPRFHSGSKEREGFQEKSEVCSIVYKVGECMQELLKSWKEFEAAQDIKKDLQNAPVLEIRIPAEHVTATNRQVKGGQLWGTDVYTDDSDLVAVLMHTGYCRPTASPPPTAIQELQATIRVLPPQDCYTSTLRNNVRSRAWGAGVRCSYQIEKCCIVKKGGGTIDLEPCLSHICAVEPSLVPVSVERTMTTRSAASNALRQQRFVREVTIQYNLCNEPWLKYSNIVIADKGLKKPLFTAARLKKGEVLYLETQFKRYELCFYGMRMASNGTMPTTSLGSDLGSEKAHHHHNGDKNHDRDNMIDVFRWSCCRKPLFQEVMRAIGIPLPVVHLEVIDDNLAWEDVQWSQTCVLVAGKEYAIARVHFLTPN